MRGVSRTMLRIARRTMRPDRGLILRDARNCALPGDEGIDLLDDAVVPGWSVGPSRTCASGPSDALHKAAGTPHFLHKSDAQHIGADQHGETADGNGEIDPLHGDPRKRPRSVASDSREPLLARSLSSERSHDHGSKRSGDVAREAAAEATSGHRSSAACRFRLRSSSDGGRLAHAGRLLPVFDADRTVRILASLHDGTYFRPRELPSLLADRRDYRHC